MDHGLSNSVPADGCCKALLAFSLCMSDEAMRVQAV